MRLQPLSSSLKHLRFDYGSRFKPVHYAFRITSHRPAIVERAPKIRYPAQENIHERTPTA